MSDLALLEFTDRSQRAASWRFELTDKEGAPIGDLTVDRDQPPRVLMDTSHSIKRSLTGMVLPAGEIDDINLLSDRMRLYMVLENGSEYPMGWYLFGQASREVPTAPPLTAEPIGHLNLVDQTVIVDQGANQPFTARPRTNLTIFTQLVLGGLPITVEYDSSSAFVHGSEAIAWPTGTSRLKIVNDIATMLGYKELYFDNNGIGQFKTMPDPMTVDEADVIDYTDTPRIFRSSVVRSDDSLDLPNRFIVVGSGASDANIIGTYDVPADAPHSAANRGFVVAYSETQQGVETNTQARQAAYALSLRRRFAQETIDFDGPADPRHDHYNVLNIEGLRVLETGWRMTLREGEPMQHTVLRTFSDPTGFPVT